MVVAYDLARVVVGGKNTTDQLGELDFLRPGDLNDTVDRVGYGSLGHCGGHVLGGDRLEIGRRNVHGVAVGSGVGGGAQELEELSRPDDRVRQASPSDQLFL